MTRFFALLALLTMLAAPATAAPLPEITVSAEGQASTMPDMALAAFSISTGAATAAQATSDNNARYERLLRGLAAIGIAKSEVRTTSFSLNYSAPPKPPDVPSQGQRYGYFVYRSVTVAVKQLALVGKTVDAAVGAGVTDVNSVSFDTSDKSGQFTRALRDAVRQARLHAEAIASAAGLHIVRVKAMQEGEPSRILPLGQPVFKAAAAVPTTIEPSAIETRATVTITYEAQ